ncbi:MAG: PAS domain S-box protein, partial [Candidatus Scalindua sp.]
IVLIRLSKLLEAANFEQLISSGYDYKLSRIEPNSDKHIVFAKSDEEIALYSVSTEINVPNGNWRLYIAPRDGWYSPLYITVEVIFAILIGTIISLLSNRIIRSTNTLRYTNEMLTLEITEREQAEEQIHKLSRVVEQSPNIIIITNTEGNIEYVNPKFSQLTGYNLKETIGATPRILKSGRTPPEVYKELWKTITSGNEWRGEFCNKKKSGEIYWESVSISPIKNDKGVITHFVAVKNDITMQKQVSQELQKTNEQLQISIEQMQTGYIIWDNEFRVLEWNHAAERIFGYSKSEILGKFAANLIVPGEARQQIEEVIENLQEGNVSSYSQKDNNIRKDGKLITCQWYNTPLKDRSGNTFSILSMVEDITERLEMENELIKTQKLESVGMLAGGIAHNFNNSLQAILGYISLAKMHTNPNDEIHEYLEEAGKAVFQSRGLTQQLLTFSKGGAPIRKSISVSELVMNSTKLALSGSNVKCELGMPNGLWPVEADKGQINQVISNLIINADQAMPEGGNIKVWTENTDIAERDSLPLQAGRYVRITIEDHGTGISQKNLQKIFDPYFTTKKNGSGLGLATAYSIIKQHNGHITVESKIRVGTIFHVYLPAPLEVIQKELALSKAEGSDNKHLEKKAEETCPVPVNGVSLEPAEGKDEEKPVISKGRILLMDDEYIIRTILCKQLSGLKYEVEAVEEGSEAIRLYERASREGKPFDAVVMDLTIPGGMGGKETIKRLLEIDPEVKAIVVSGYANDPIMANYKKYGFSGVLPKPHEIRELDEQLQKVMMEVS